MINLPFITFISNIFLLELLTLVKEIVLKETLLEINNNGIIRRVRSEADASAVDDGNISHEISYEAILEKEFNFTSTTW